LAAPGTVVEPLPGGVAGVRAYRRGAGGAARTNRVAFLRSLRGCAPVPALRRGRQACRAVRARGADRGARGPGRRRVRTRTAAATGAAAIRTLSGRGGALRAGAARALIELPVQRLRADAVL